MNANTQQMNKMEAFFTKNIGEENIKMNRIARNQAEIVQTADNID